MSLCPEAALAEDRYAFVRHCLARLPMPFGGGVLFDIGAGTLPMKADVEEAGYEWFGFDLHPKSRDIAQWDIDTPFLGNRRADIVLLMDVIEHTYNPGNGHAQHSKGPETGWPARDDDAEPSLEPSANHASLLRLSRLLHSPRLGCEPSCLHDLPHIVLKLMRDVGLKPEQYVTLDRDEIKSKPLGLLSPVRAIEGLIRRIIEARDPSARGMSYAFVARPEMVDAK